MNALIAIALCGLAAGFGTLLGFLVGERRGRDVQRVDDIIEMWKRMPDRDTRGRFKARCNLVCERNKCCDTSEAKS